MAKEYISREAALTVLDWDCASQDALNAIKAIHAADVVEVRHASWRQKTADRRAGLFTAHVATGLAMTHSRIGQRDGQNAAAIIIAQTAGRRWTEGWTMYEELVKRLRYTAVDAKTIAEAADAITELSKPRWIPVTEEQDGKV